MFHVQLAKYMHCSCEVGKMPYAVKAYSRIFPFLLPFYSQPYYPSTAALPSIRTVKGQKAGWTYSFDHCQDDQVFPSAHITQGRPRLDLIGLLLTCK